MDFLDDLLREKNPNSRQFRHENQKKHENGGVNGKITQRAKTRIDCRHASEFSLCTTSLTKKRNQVSRNFHSWKCIHHRWGFDQLCGSNIKGCDFFDNMQPCRTSFQILNTKTLSKTWNFAPQLGYKFCREADHCTAHKNKNSQAQINSRQVG